MRVLRYQPAIDSEFTNGAAPYAQMFGDRAMWGGRPEWARTATRASVDDFGSARSWDLSTRGWALSGGFTFAF